MRNTFNVLLGGSADIAAAGLPLNKFINALGHGWQMFGINMVEATVVANLTESNSRTVLRTQLRATNGLPATLHVGDKYPILTSGYYGPASAKTGSPATYTPPPSFTYQDLGVSLKVLPTVGNNDLITLDIDTVYQLLAGQSINGIPVLANRQMTTRVTVHNDEWAVVGGLVNRAETKSVNGIAGLARIPLLGWFFRVSAKEKDRDHIVIVLRPHIVGDPPSNNETEPMRVGTETRPLSPL
jgi:type II secretory pathway component GspD/PulD (secretin)